MSVGIGCYGNAGVWAGRVISPFYKSSFWARGSAAHECSRREDSVINVHRLERQCSIHSSFCFGMCTCCTDYLVDDSSIGLTSPKLKSERSGLPMAIGPRVRQSIASFAIGKERIARSRVVV